MSDGGVLRPGEDGKSLPKDEWKKRLKPMEYCVCRESDTERPFSGLYENHFEPGIYTCLCCGTELFESKTKYKTHCGWPSFYAPIVEDRITRKVDTTYQLVRTEVVCSKCNAHLGHVFDDGPKPTGERFCINSVSLNFKPEKNSI
ncbi:hypothetical protein HELRODRAFT_90179 [Helobdella robusta]|uniref:Peptide-methionine (R)-S-oxide reductase n=1 Tax=Helobdella robusta TaxID=6412 RepID=T1G7L9_HELRO|nr:hypothetical protein HELRODRAFT_90179 [Helobdella robusta]ESN91954.1 hypothetical protein HELRODRAFT_90179 [Helobdella robusta]